MEDRKEGGKEGREEGRRKEGRRKCQNIKEYEFSSTDLNI
jgi:hypothetical protein